MERYARDDQPERSTDRARGWDRGTDDLTEPEWVSLLAAVDLGAYDDPEQ